jgi:hypothetical protein
MSIDNEQTNRDKGSGASDSQQVLSISLLVLCAADGKPHDSCKDKPAAGTIAAEAARSELGAC